MTRTLPCHTANTPSTTPAQNNGKRVLHKCADWWHDRALVATTPAHANELAMALRPAQMRATMISLRPSQQPLGLGVEDSAPMPIGDCVALVAPSVAAS
mmetsp:Transcript_41251/g.108964  ORF Transcript_41251/g.108964 Transcript_41251/m.108964 type:complete len:99 (-) Transcript_41251:938-1234(-)